MIGEETTARILRGAENSIHRKDRFQVQESMNSEDRWNDATARSTVPGVTNSIKMNAPIGHDVMRRILRRHIVQQEPSRRHPEEKRIGRMG